MMPTSHRCSVSPVIHLQSSHLSPEKRFRGPLVPELPIAKGCRVISGFVSVHHPYSSRNPSEKEEPRPCLGTQARKKKRRMDPGQASFGLGCAGGPSCDDGDPFKKSPVWLVGLNACNSDAELCGDWRPTEGPISSSAVWAVFVPTVV
ncbi:hypothetical protein MRB53_025919 [Persea americana]|uniref:Uncharacterized protein n=1 Tax=Persea americana TaxID=3435 RepID=A0ACC2LHE0_PERAE|nr:hypothetical protein MRB53_025919 [Persea americana]